MIEHIHLKDCHSTQDILKEQLMGSNVAQHILVSCEDQKSGRGRGDKIWSSMPGTLCFSVSLKPHSELSLTAIEISVLIAKFFETKGKSLMLKWPNDLLNDQNQKCGGILVQAISENMLTGIGINLFSDSMDFGGVYEAAFELDKKTWAREITEFILAHRYLNKNSLIEDWKSRCGHMDSEVQITESTEVFSGKFTGLGSHGEAILGKGEESIHLYNGSLTFEN